MFSYIGLVIFAHAAHARVGKENFQYLPKPNCCICLEHLPIHVSHANYLNLKPKPQAEPDAMSSSRVPVYAQEFSYAVDNVLWVGKLWPRECVQPRSLTTHEKAKKQLVLLGRLSLWRANTDENTTDTGRRGTTR